jgi:Flp pilus assembly secretin CpaC
MVGALVGGVPYRAVAGERLVVTVDQSELLDLPQEAFTRVSVTNPNIAEVVVISPTQILVNGKTPGITSLLVFYAKKVRQFDLSVQSPPLGPAGVIGRDAGTHAVVIQRGDKVFTHTFAQDQAKQWVELGAKSEPALEVKK